MPSSRGRAAPALPRWIADPHAADFASAELLAAEAASDEHGLAGSIKPFSRFLVALDAIYGKDQWPSHLAKPPRWPGGWMPGRRYDRSAYEVLPDGPPERVRAAVDAYQAEDETRRAAPARVRVTD